MAIYIENMRTHFQQNKRIRERTAHDSKVHSVARSCDGRRLASDSFDKTVSVFQLDNDRDRIDQSTLYKSYVPWPPSLGKNPYISHKHIVIDSYPDLKLQHTLNVHTASCICIEFDPKGKYFATGSADALVSIWDVKELACIRTLSRLEWPVRTLSFSHDGKMLASAPEDLIINIAEIDSVSLVEAIYLEYAHLLTNLGLS
ncbi:THO complex subunit 3-like [Crassostrea angulata]|uniref:THO complex subunit 3-like n=1 Tax=Magallana angulata TaxID=2784310 RepID=UPI0022B0A2CF|nr:THO complex subunit 3-like [Crassostrea angulata]